MKPFAFQLKSTQGPPACLFTTTQPGESKCGDEDAATLQWSFSRGNKAPRALIAPWAHTLPRGTCRLAGHG